MIDVSEWINKHYVSFVRKLFLWAAREMMISRLDHMQHILWLAGGYASHELMCDIMQESTYISRFFENTASESVTLSAVYVLWDHVMDLEAQYKKLRDF